MRLSLLLVGLFCYATTLAQIIPADRVVEWTTAGNQNLTFFEENQEIDITTLGAIGDGTFDNSTIVRAAIDALAGTPGTIFFPAGTYFFAEPIILPSFTQLRGEGANHSHFKFNLGGSESLISAAGTVDEEEIAVIDAIGKGAQLLRLATTNGLTPNDYLYLFDEDQDLVTSEWALHSTGQVVQIAEIIDGQTVQLKEAVRRGYELPNTPRIQKVNPVQDIAITQLSIERQDQSTYQTSNIRLDWAVNGKISCIESSYANFAHVEVNNSCNISINGSYFHHAFAYGNGGQGYGVLLQNGTGGCIVEDNVFNQLRHAMILQAGANGNVFAFNYSTNSFWTGTALPPEAAGDLVLHGNYPYANLFEGNIVQNIVLDNSHGANGPFNTFFRNRAELYGIIMDFGTNQQNFVGNEIPDLAFLRGLYNLEGEDHFEYGNNDGGTILPEGTSELGIEVSCYLNETPAYYLQANAWPPIGLPNAISTHTISAKHRFENGQLTNCTDAISTSAKDIVIQPEVSVFPNPATTVLQIEGILQSDILQLHIFNSHGQLVNVLSEATLELPTDGLPKGMYVLQIYTAQKKRIIRRFIKS